MEEGEIVPSSSSGTADYDPAYEWLGDSDISSREIPERSALNPWLPLRLRVLQSSILHNNLNLAVLDAYGEAQFGRDVAPAGSETPRIRLKEMEVSKLHATAFWDKAQRGWAVPDADPTRLSPPRVASIPRPLRHLDRLIIGSTTFLCHIHEDRIPCAECTSTGQRDIPLFAVPKDGSRAAAKRPEARDPKKALTTLKRALLSRLDPHNQAPSSTPTGPAHLHRPTPSSAVAEQSQTPGPLSEGNVGRRLLMKQGWQPGTSLSSSIDRGGDNDASGLIEPIEVSPTPHRAGLGMPQKPAAARLTLPGMEGE
ncbi:hypothetical protein BU15DRAFT_89029 [Melanogaster broomeanus]|nr:hypothetical protein BU15DRAFT_89029 [Melanogaster broomeanus]